MGATLDPSERDLAHAARVHPPGDRQRKERVMGKRRGDYYPDTMSRRAREVVEANRSVQFWQDFKRSNPNSSGMLDLAEECARWHASELIAASTAPQEAV
jgi:hypothetical protein